MGSMFGNWKWRFRAGIEPSGRKWEVLYYSTMHGREGIQRFVNEAAAREFAAKNGGTVREITPKPFRLAGAR